MTRTSAEDVLIDEIRALTQHILTTIHGKGPVPQAVRQVQLLEAQFRSTQSYDMRRPALKKLTVLKRDLHRLRSTGC